MPVMVGRKYWFEKLGPPAGGNRFRQSELRYREPRSDRRKTGCGLLFISQSGETADTLAALKPPAKAKGQHHHVRW